MSLSGKKVVLTGTLSQLKRADAAAKITAAGGQVMSGVSKNVDIVVCGADAGSKLEKAESLGLEIWDEDKLVKAVGAGGGAAKKASTKKAAPKRAAEEKKAAPAKKAKTPAKKTAGGAKLSGKKFVITGTLTKGRAAIKDLIESNGGKVVGAMSKNVDICLAGDGAGSKQAAAEAMGVTIWCEAELDEALE